MRVIILSVLICISMGCGSAVNKQKVVPEAEEEVIKTQPEKSPGIWNQSKFGSSQYQ